MRKRVLAVVVCLFVLVAIPIARYHFGKGTEPAAISTPQQHEQARQIPEAQSNSDRDSGNTAQLEMPPPVPAIDLAAYLPLTSLTVEQAKNWLNPSIEKLDVFKSVPSLNELTYAFVAARANWRLTPSPDTYAAAVNSQDWIPTPEEAAQYYEDQFIVPFGSPAERIGLTKDPLQAVVGENVAQILTGLEDAKFDSRLEEIRRPPLDAEDTVFIAVKTLVKFQESNEAMLHTEIAGFDAQSGTWVSRYEKYQVLTNGLLDVQTLLETPSKAGES